jgi:heme/copper-type cytochrome/quinol oxidase subunit 1
MLLALLFIYTLYSYDLIKLPIYLFAIFITSQLMILFVPLCCFFAIVSVIDFDSFLFIFGIVSEDPAPQLSKFIRFCAHPVLYVILLPSIGLISQTVFYLTKRDRYTKKYIIQAMWFIGFLGYIS